MNKKIFWFFFYNLLVVPGVFLISLILFPFVKKIRQGICGRVGMFKRLSKIKSTITSSEKKIVWFHVASAGEFEQVLPLIASIKESDGRIFSLVTFFSPSGYNFYKKKSFSFIDFAEYSPLDTPFSVIRFLMLLKPDALILTRYDIWPNMIWFSYLTRVKIIMINGSLQRFSKRFKFVARLFYKSIYSCFHFIGTITKADEIRFKDAVGDHTTVVSVGDTKYDRVVKRKSGYEISPVFEGRFKEKTLIAASIWEEDEKILFSSLKELYKKYNRQLSIIIVPHEPREKILNQWRDFFISNSISFMLLSDLDENSASFDALLIDRVGMLAELYRLSKVAYVGGGMSSGGVHNILEPAIYGNATLFGENFKNSYEANSFVENSISKIIKTSDEFTAYVTKLFDNPDLLAKVSSDHISKVNYFCGATDKYLNYVLKYLKP